MNDLRSRLYLATLSDDAPALAEAFGLGLELDHFCTAMNLDADFDAWDARARADMAHADRLILHAPFAELTPCAVDPMIGQVSRHRLLQAVNLCARYGIRRMVVHSGFVPRVYFRIWYVEKSSAFFRALLADCPRDFELLIENVLDPDPEVLLEMVQAIGDPRARLCLDVGHAHVASRQSVADWIDLLSPLLAHLHIHDNDGAFDAHLPPGRGSIGFPGLFDRIQSAAPRATLTLECPDAAGCIAGLKDFGIL